VLAGPTIPSLRDRRNKKQKGSQALPASPDQPAPPPNDSGCSQSDFARNTLNRQTSSLLENLKTLVPGAKQNGWIAIGPKTSVFGRLQVVHDDPGFSRICNLTRQRVFGQVAYIHLARCKSNQSIRHLRKVFPMERFGEFSFHHRVTCGSG